ncbi:hypothetical protein ACFXHA_34020 [Nocardia sp. NPDC059240]|uniref:hypothetical protein n=1 Tax=Nocardia sp. NPDC059240 TaxID=3346786 RepID=UPI0036AF1804
MSEQHADLVEPPAFDTIVGVAGASLDSLSPCVVHAQIGRGGSATDSRRAADVWRCLVAEKLWIEQGDDMSGSLWVQVGHEVSRWWLRADQVIGFRTYDHSPYDAPGDGPRNILVEVRWIRGDDTSDEVVVRDVPSMNAAGIVIRDLIAALAKHRDDTGVLVFRDGHVKFVDISEMQS